MCARIERSFTLPLTGDIADILIRRGVNVNAADLSGQTPLHCSAIEGNAGMARFLLEKGAIVDASDKSGNTPLHLASSVDIVKMLIDHGADINRENKSGGHSAQRGNPGY